MQSTSLFDGQGMINQRLLALVRQSYQNVKDPDEVYYHEDEETVFDILAEQAVLHDDMEFFRKILAKTEGTLYGNDYFFAAVAQTGHSHFVEELLKADVDYSIYNFFEHKTKANALATITSFGFLFSVEKQFEMFTSCSCFSCYDTEVALAFLERGIPFDRIMAMTCEEARYILKKEDV